MSSEVELILQLISITLQKPRVDGKKLQLEANKPFDFILNFTDQHAWLPGQDADRTFIVDVFMPERILAIIGNVSYAVN